MELDSKIYVAGHNGLVGSAIVRQLILQGYSNIITADKSQLDLRNESQVSNFFEYNKPEYVFNAAAKVGGINYNNTSPAEFIYDNLQIQNNMIHQSYLHNVKKFIFLGSSCIYPKFSKQPIKEEYLLTSELEPTNEAYAIAKIAGIEMCKMYKRQYEFNAISVMPTNVYGINDNFNLYTSHVIPSLIRKFIEAKNYGFSSVEVWGDGSPRREFIYSDDLALACIFLINNYDEEMHINVGVNNDITINDLAKSISRIVEFNGTISWNKSYPNGTPVKRLDSSKIYNLGWRPQISLYDGLYNTINWFIRNKNDSRL